MKSSMASSVERLICVWLCMIWSWGWRPNCKWLNLDSWHLLVHILDVVHPFCCVAKKGTHCVLVSMGSHKKKQEKKFTTVVNYLQKWRTPPLPLFHNKFSRFRNLKIDVFFAIIKSLWMRGIDKVSLKDLFKVKL